MSIQKHKTLPAVVVGTGTMGYAVIRALATLKIPIIGIYYDKNDIGFVSKWVTHNHFVPNPFVDEENFIKHILELSEKIGKSLLIPASDASLMAISRHKSALEPKYIVACTEWNIAKLFIEKKRTYSLAESIGVPIARTIVPKSIADVEEYSKDIEFPCLIKPSRSHTFYRDFDTKMIQVENINDLITFYSKAEELGHEIVIQEIIPGDTSCGVSYNSYFWDNQSIVEFTAKQIRNAPPEYGSPCIMKSEAFPAVVELGRKMLKALGYYGFCNIEFHKDPRDGIYKLMDINGRHSLASSILATRCGINFPAMHYKHMVLGELPSHKDYQQEVFWIDLVRDVYHHGGKGVSSPQDFFEPYFNPHIFAILNAEDLTPFLRRCTNLLKNLLSPLPFSKKKRSP